MTEEEKKHDIKEFNKLRDSINSLWEELELDKKEKDKLLKGKNKKEFIDALECATEFTNSIAPFYDGLEKEELYKIQCDFKNDRKSKIVKKVEEQKIKDLDQYADYVKYYTKHPELSSLFLEITLRCNARCEHCGSSCGDEIPKDEISKEDLMKALKEIDEKYGAETVFLIVTGGEPLVRKDAFEIIDYALKLGYHWGMTTNGILIDEKMVQKLKKTKIESISISLDGLKSTHESFRRVPGSFDKIMKAIDLLKDVDTLRYLQITTVANKKNLLELEDVYKLLLEKGIKEWRVMCVDPIGRATDNDDILLDKDGLLYMFNFIREKRLEGKMNVTYDCSHYLGLEYEGILRDHPFICGAGLFVASILANGDICVCPNVRRKELVQGNIKTDSFVDVWENRFEQFRGKRITTNSKCKKCKSYKYCRGDSFHTWNFDDKKPNMCMKELLEDYFIE